MDARDKPGHDEFRHTRRFPSRILSRTLRSQTIIAARHEINKPAVAQILKLLPYLRLDVLVAGIEIAEMPLESVDLVEREIAFAK